MGELQPPSFLQAASHPADTVRLIPAALLVREGVLAYNQLLTTATTPTANMQTHVSAGYAAIAGDTRPGAQGMYLVRNDTEEIITHDPADVSLARKDRVIAQIRDDTEDGLGFNDWQIVALPGTPAASPALPALPDNSLHLAEVNVVAGATAISAANIVTLARFVAGPNSPFTVCHSTLRPTGVLGLAIYEFDTGVFYIHNGTTYIEFGRLGAWLPFTPVWSGVVLGTGGTNVGRVRRDGSLVNFVVQMVLGAGGNVTTTMSLNLPVTSAAIPPSGVFPAWGTNPVGNVRNGATAIQLTTNQISRFASSPTSLGWDSVQPHDWVQNSQIVVTGFYEAA